MLGWYKLDDNCYLTFWNGNEEMDLFSFIRHFDPTKVLIGERERAEGEVKLLTMTEGRVVPLVPLSVAASGGNSDSIDKLFNEGAMLDRTSPSKRKKKTARDASGSGLPPKKLRDDYHVAYSNTGGKSLAAIRGLIQEGSSIPSDVAEPHVVIFVAPTLTCRDGGPTDSVSELNLRTRPPGA
ncbi:hypothetical protein Tco_1158633, partial [Tanacetum coccineum]